MLAPRKTLWSTPDPVLKTVVSWIHLEEKDIVCDVGCGDGRVLIEWASKQTLPMQFIGLEIDAQRAQQAQQNVQDAYTSGVIAPHVQVTIHCANAVEETHLYKDATVFFLYLIPRGLRLMKPILKEIAREQCAGQSDEESEPLKVITYMAPLPHETYVSKEVCRVEHQPGAEWPLYLYHLYPEQQQQRQDETV